jgi:hypothetical protein
MGFSRYVQNIIVNTVSDLCRVPPAQAVGRAFRRRPPTPRPPTPRPPTRRRPSRRPPTPRPPACRRPSCWRCVARRTFWAARRRGLTGCGMGCETGRGAGYPSCSRTTRVQAFSNWRRCSRAFATTRAVQAGAVAAGYGLPGLLPTAAAAGLVQARPAQQRRRVNHRFQWAGTLAPLLRRRGAAAERRTTTLQLAGVPDLRLPANPRVHTVDAWP